MMRTSLAAETRHRGMGWMNSPMPIHRILRSVLAIFVAFLLPIAGAMAADVDADQKLNRSMNPADFEGTWDTVTRGVKFEVTLLVSGTRVTGGYTSPGQPDWDGTIEGDIRLIGETMRLNYKWNSHKLGQSGEGTFYVHTDDRLTGGITVKEPGKKGTYYRWKGKRTSRYAVIDYGGCAGCTSGGGTTSGGTSFADKVLEFARNKVDAHLGSGECTDLVSAALAYAGAPPGDTSSPEGFFTWGRKINFPAKSAQPGDIIQLVNVKLSFNDGNSTGDWETTTQHTAIIESVNGKLLKVIDQNAPPGSNVRRNEINLNWTLERGSYAIYRP